jgi:hypothetical protein
MLMTVPVILDQAVGYCSLYFGSRCWLLFKLFCIKLLVTVPIISLIPKMGTGTNSLI